MNFTKHMEALFVAAAVVAGFATYATADVIPAPAPSQAMISTDGQVATVVVSTKRLTAAQKADIDS